MSFTNPPVSFVQQYGQNVYMLAQQMESRLRNMVVTETVTGEVAFFEQYDTTAMEAVNSRLSDTPLRDTNFARRRVSLTDFVNAQATDMFDRVRTLIDPLNPIVKAQAAAAGRQIDSLITAAFFADALTGKTGSTTVSFPASQQVAVSSWAHGTGSGNAGLTISKLIEAKRILDANEVESDGRCLVLGARQLADLLGTTEATSADYNTVKALVYGEIDTFMGFKFVRTELLPVDGSSYRRVCAFQKNSMGLGIGKDITAKISELPAKNYAVQAYVAMTMGATRLQEKGVVEIKCIES